MVLAVILLVCLAISLLLNIGAIANRVPRNRAGSYGPQRSAGPRLDETLVQDNGARSKLAVIEINGIITGHQTDQGWSMVDAIKAQLDRARDDEAVRAVILKVDSPGGEVLASDEINRAISTFQKATGKPVIASMGSLAASGGYYVSVPCRWIVANDLTLTGSIGVIMSSYNYRGLMDKVGLVPQTFKSGKHKDMLSGSRELSEIPPDEREMIQKLIDETYQRFKTVVQVGRDAAYEKNRNNSQKMRGRPLSDSWQDYADGRVLSGTEAFRLGFVDELGNFDDAVARAKALADVRKVNIIQYQQHYDFADFLRLFGKSEAKAVKVEIGMDLPKLQAGLPYFLAPTFAH